MDNEYKIIITNLGHNESNGIFIGRRSTFGNPFPTKKSSYSDTIYSLEDSLQLYEKLLIDKRINIDDLALALWYNDSIQLNCYCINEIITKDYDFTQPIKCHGIILAKYIFKELDNINQIINLV